MTSSYERTQETIAVTLKIIACLPLYLSTCFCDGLYCDTCQVLMSFYFVDQVQ